MKNKIFEIAAKTFNVPFDSLRDETSPDTLPEWTSLNHMNFTLALEETFNIQLSMKDIVEMLTLEIAFQIITEKLPREAT